MQTWTVEKARVLLMMHLFRDLTVKAYYSSAYCTSNILKLTTLPVLRVGATYTKNSLQIESHVKISES